MEVVRFGTLDLARVTRAEAVAWIRARAVERTACVVVTSNIHHLRLAEIDPAFRAVVAKAELNVADGWPLVAGARALGRRLPERVAGVDLVDDLLQGNRLDLAVVGGAPGAADRLAGRVAGRHDVVLVDSLPRGSWETPEGTAALQARLARAAPQLTLLGLGAPQQELLADRLRNSVAGPILCCGASIEFLAGLRTRAPRALQAVGLEWAFRLALEPARLAPRYAVAAPAFARVLATELRRGRLRRGREKDDRA
jgi:N-acetylglucosaminyldiphosphoundecaprenol N-acetyl-beta-D-mannosaminyltransferase